MTEKLLARIKSASNANDVNALIAEVKANQKEKNVVTEFTNKVAQLGLTYDTTTGKYIKQ